MERRVGGRRHVIELLGGKILRRPYGARVRRHTRPAVIRHHEVRRIFRINPEVVEIAVRVVADVRHRLAGIRRLVDAVA